MAEKQFKTPLVSCIWCREVKSARGIFSHYLFAHEKEKSNYANCNTEEAMRKTSEKLKKAAEIKQLAESEVYYQKPAVCKSCSAVLPFNRKKNKFCNPSCSATYNNKLRSPESQIKRSATIRKHSEMKRSKKPEIVGPYTKIYLCTCKHTSKQWYSPTVKTIHPDTKDSKSQYGGSCRFTFGISTFPLWFVDASNLIKQYGWYSTPGSKRTGTKNVNGISRDHLYSVSDGWKNNIDPVYIRHPANCELKPHSLNQQKGTKSSISIDELMSRIASFEKLYPNATLR